MDMFNDMRKTEYKNTVVSIRGFRNFAMYIFRQIVCGGINMLMFGRLELG